MRIVHLPAELAPLPKPIAFVPTMGALHDGHLELVRQAYAKGGTVVVSIFVNPTQFGPGEDFTRYPRDLDRDAALARSAGADVVYSPSVETMYPSGETTKVVVPEVASLFEGAHRPGHFDGVATVVLKLLNQVRPSTAFFGRKDLQQCAVIRRMVHDLDLAVALEFVPTVREPDGLAMSSRNVYLTPAERAIAPRLHAAVQRLADDEATIVARLPVERESLAREGFDIDYLELVSTESFRPTSTAGPGAALVVAGRLGKTRLIDNIELGAS